MTYAGDWDLRGRDYETELVGPIRDQVIDADRLVRKRRWRYGMPVWEMYRAAYCGDYNSIVAVKQAAIRFAAAYGDAGGVRSDARSDELYGIAGLDAAYRLIYGKWMISEREGGRLCNVHNATYDRFRTTVWRVLNAMLQDYWSEMISAYIALASEYRK